MTNTYLPTSLCEEIEKYNTLESKFKFLQVYVPKHSDQFTFSADEYNSLVDTLAKQLEEKEEDSTLSSGSDTEEYVNSFTIPPENEYHLKIPNQQ